jgi:hypothetical protein
VVILNLSDEVGTYVLDLDTFVLPERKTHANLMFLTERMMGCQCCKILAVADCCGRFFENHNG